MRVLVTSGICVCMAVAVCDPAWAQDSAAAATDPTQPAAQDPAAIDPFAVSEANEASRQPSSATPQTTETTATMQEEPDFTEGAAASPSQDAPTQDKTPSRFTASLDLLYQGKYLPKLIRSGKRDQVEQDVFIDSTLNWTMSEDATLGARIVANHEERKSGSASSHRNDLTALEYFYRQQFAGGAQALTIGRKVIGWSSGFQWRPADLIDNGFSTKSIDIQDPYRYRGVGQIRYELIQPKFDIVAIASNHEKGFFGGEQFATKLSIKSTVDVSLMYAINGDYSRKYGVIVDSNLPWGSTLALEAVHVDIDRDKMTDASHFGKTLESLSGIHRYQDVYLSLTKFIDDKRRMSFDYFHNGRGLDDVSLLGRRLSIAAAASTASRVVDTSIFSQQYLGRSYVYIAYTGYLDAWQLQFKPSVLMNTADSSFIGSISVKRELGDSSELTLNLNTFHGEDDSEFGSVTNGLGFGVSYLFHFL